LNFNLRRYTTVGDGGAVKVVQGTATFQRVDFIDNSPSTGFNGGAVDLSGLSTATFTECNFTRNSAPAYQGGGVRVGGGRARFTRCAFTANDAGYGGAIYAAARSVVTADTCVFDKNSADSEGAVAFVAAGGNFQALTSAWGDNGIKAEDAVHLVDGRGLHSFTLELKLS